MNDNKLIISGSDVISEIIRIFENESLVVKNTLRIKKLFSFIILILVINGSIWLFFRNNVHVFDTTIIFATFIYFVYIFVYFLKRGI